MQDQLVAKEAVYSIQYHRWSGFIGCITGILFILNIYLGDKIRIFNCLWPTVLMASGFTWMFYHVNPAHFKNFSETTFFQLQIEPSLGLGITLSLLVLLIGGLIFARNK